MTTARIEGLHTPQELAAASRSLLYQRLAGAFAFPTPPTVEAIGSGQFLEGLLAESRLLPFALPVLQERPEALAGLSLTAADFQAEYIRLFEVGRGRPLCPLYEGAHRPGRLRLLEDIVRFYDHFGLRGLAGDLPDHISSELEFMHYLSFKETAAYHLRQRWRPYVLAQGDFLARHLRAWLPRLCARLERCQPPPFFAALARLTEEFCQADLGHLRSLSAGGSKGKPYRKVGSLPD